MIVSTERFSDPVVLVAETLATIRRAYLLRAKVMALAAEPESQRIRLQVRKGSRASDEIAWTN
jgi:hypothetical protein